MKKKTCGKGENYDNILLLSTVIATFHNNYNFCYYTLDDNIPLSLLLLLRIQSILIIS